MMKHITYTDGYAKHLYQLVNAYNAILVHVLINALINHNNSWSSMPLLKRWCSFIILYPQNILKCA